jgi:hypothetical protein
MAALAACFDTPTSAALAPPEAPALVLTVSSSGGYPLVSWDPVPGATSYTVRFVTMLVFPSGGTQRMRTDLATTTGTSYLDASRVYTGDTSCPRSDPQFGTWTERYQYVIVAQLASGTSMQTVDAPVGECY